MGAQAPDVLVLIQANLRGRDARGLAEDYLDVVGWPHAERRRSSPTTRGLRSPRIIARRRQNQIEAALRVPADPTRN